MEAPKTTSMKNLSGLWICYFELLCLVVLLDMRTKQKCRKSHRGVKSLTLNSLHRKASLSRNQNSMHLQPITWLPPAVLYEAFILAMCSK